ncbi:MULTISPECIES: hypothetical protein [unclassified Arthrobacter]|uniref:hypothetical protein n=1 Tax=unclassified Arthrobacter TaxID=235627 RepID=UPI001F11465F|nr:MULTISPECIES: hypothetical protein [unclassified Arthrobacter]
MAAVRAHHAGQPVWQARREVVDVAVPAVAFVVSCHEFKRKAGTRVGRHKVTPALFLSRGTVGEVAKREVGVRLNGADPGQHAGSLPA